MGYCALMEVIPTAEEKAIEDFAALARMMKAMSEHAEEIAKSRRALFLAYVKEGFTEAQALELCTKLGV